MAVKNCSENNTVIVQFVILGFLTPRALGPLLFLIFSNIYLFSIAGNSMIVITVSMHRRLHSPMYFFLGNLSFLEIWYIITFMPTILGGFFPEGRIISYTSCITQCFFAGFLLSTECCLLLAMAYDRYVAICFPLHYPTVMDQRVCLQLAGSSWMGGFIIALFVIFPIGQLQFSKLNIIDHFFCDLGPLIQAACSDTSAVEIDIFVLSVFAFLIPFPVIIVSYTFIVSAIMKIPSALGRERAFSTCSSHLLVVAIYFGSLISTYYMPKTGSSLRVGKFSSLLYTTATPLLNPIIYALRNKAIREVLGNVLRKKYDMFSALVSGMCMMHYRAR